MLRYLLTVAHGNLVYPFGNVFIDLKHTRYTELLSLKSIVDAMCKITNVELIDFDSATVMLIDIRIILHLPRAR